MREGFVVRHTLRPGTIAVVHVEMYLPVTPDRSRR